MKTFPSLFTILILGLSPAMAQDADEDATAEQSTDDSIPETADGAKMLTGMSILGNEETPKSLVIVPWKSSEMGDELSLSDTLDDRARPVDKEVFLRELRFYELRAAE
jgi:hypothetical protein